MLTFPVLESSPRPFGCESFTITASRQSMQKLCFIFLCFWVCLSTIICCLQHFSRPVLISSDVGCWSDPVMTLKVTNNFSQEEKNKKNKNKSFSMFNLIASTLSLSLALFCVSLSVSVYLSLFVFMLFYIKQQFIQLYLCIYLTYYLFYNFICLLLLNLVPILLVFWLFNISITVL